MPKKIAFEKKGNFYEYEIFPVVNNKNYYSYLRLPAELGRELKGKKLKVKIEVID